jgi:hypothetical protein
MISWRWLSPGKAPRFRRNSDPLRDRLLNRPIIRDEYLIYDVEKPEERNWSVLIAGSATGQGCYAVRSGTHSAGLRLNLLSLVGARPQGRDTPVVATVESSSGQVVENGRVNVMTTVPDGGADVVPMDCPGESTRKRWSGLRISTKMGRRKATGAWSESSVSTGAGDGSKEL